MRLSARIDYCGSIDGRTRTAIASLLECSGVYACEAVEAEAGAAGLGIVVFDAVDDSLLGLLHTHSRAASVLALSVCPQAPTSPVLWSLLEAGATDVLQWPSLPAAADDVACRLDRWARVDALLASPAVARTLVGASAAWRRVLRGIVEVAAFTSASVLITGESGTGKERVAQLVHELDPRPDKGDFVVVDCSTVSRELSGSEFFGHERGAFTGANSARDGAFALADKGTLFLDEVGELSLELQAQLLRAVQEHKFKRVGSNVWQASAVRLVAATNRDLERCIGEGSFRADFFYRIAGWRCRTVPLGERKDDILALAEHFIAELRPGQEGLAMEPAVREFLVVHDYPGNVRELRQLMTRICHRHAGPGPITIGDIAPEDRAAAGSASALWPESSFRSAVRVAVELGIGMKDIGQTATELAIEFALERESGNLQRAAARLGVTDRALQIRRAGQRGASPAASVPG